MAEVRLEIVAKARGPCRVMDATGSPGFHDANSIHVLQKIDSIN